MLEFRAWKLVIQKLVFITSKIHIETLFNRGYIIGELSESSIKFWTALCLY